MFLDGLAQPPDGIATLTTKHPKTAYDGTLNRSVEKVVKAWRRRWPAVEYLALVEFTSGQGRSSAGKRRIHLHVLLKNCDDLGEAEKIARRIWRKRTDAHRVAVEPVRTLAALTHYLANHHGKPEQRPPAWWEGRRERASRGYWHRPIAELREEAAAVIREKRLVRRAIREVGPDDALAVEHLVSKWRAMTWDVVQVGRQEWDRLAGEQIEALARRDWHLGGSLRPIERDSARVGG